jgi:AcrR family transcriptional regulator
VTQNSIATEPEDVATRVARETLARRNATTYEVEVRRLLDAAMAEIRLRGTTSRPRVADIVAAAGLSNDAFYRHFPSKDALVAALLEDGSQRLQSYLAHQMEKGRTPQAQVRRWVDGILSQADAEIAETTLAVLYNSTGTDDARGAGRHFASAPLATLLHEPFRQLGSRRPELDATFVAHAVMGTLSDHLWQRTRPTAAETEHLVSLCVSVATTS